MLVCFLVFHWLARKHLILLVDVVSGFKSFSEAPCLAGKCGTRRCDSLLGLCNLPHRGDGGIAKPGLLCPLVWSPWCDIVN
jgi:hypothetical protein